MLKCSYIVVTNTVSSSATANRPQSYPFVYTTGPASNWPIDQDHQLTGCDPSMGCPSTDGSDWPMGSNMAIMGHDDRPNVCLKTY